MTSLSISHGEADFRAAWRAAFAAFGDAVKTSALALILAQERAAARWRLERLDDSALKDMGLTRADVAREIDKPVWRA